MVMKKLVTSYLILLITAIQTQGYTENIINGHKSQYTCPYSENVPIAQVIDQKGTAGSSTLIRSEHAYTLDSFFMMGPFPENVEIIMSLHCGDFHFTEKRNVQVADGQCLDYVDHEITGSIIKKEVGSYPIIAVTTIRFKSGYELTHRSYAHLIIK